MNSNVIRLQQCNAGRRVVQAGSALAALVVGIVHAAPAGAQPFEPIIPRNFDMSGIWVVEPRPQASTRVDIGRCDRLLHAQTNTPSYGRSWVELRSTGTTVEDSGFGDPILKISYQGVLHFFQGYVSIEPVAGEPNMADVDGTCHVEAIDYSLTGSLDYDLRNERINFFAYGPAQNPPPYEHGASAAISAGWIGDAMTGWPVFFMDVTGDRTTGVVGAGEPVNEGVLPEGCEYRGITAPYEISLSYCDVRAFEAWPISRSDQPPGIPTGVIAGTLFEGQPDGTNTGEVVTTARVLLFEQDKKLRAQRTGESDEDYQSFLADQRKKRKLVAETKPDAGGHFSFGDVPVLSRIENGRGGAYRTGLYSVEIVEAEKLEEIEPGEMGTLMFLVETETDVRVGTDSDIVLTPAADVSVKWSLSENISAKAPDQYGPAELGVQVYLNQFQNGTLTLTPERLEGVRRAVWSERAVYLATTFADEMLGILLDSISGMLTDLFKDHFSTKNAALSEAEEKLENLEAAQSFALAESKGFSEFSPFNDAAGVGQIDDAITRLMDTNPMLADYKLFETVMNMFKMFFKSIKLGLVRFGLTPANAQSLVDFMEGRMLLLIQAIISGERNDIYAEVIKGVIASLKDGIFDPPSDAIPSYAGLTKDSLQMSLTRMESWSTADEPLYQQHRQLAVDRITDLNDKAETYLDAVAYGQALSQGLGDAADVYELIPIPAMKTAAKLSKLGKFFADVSNVVTPFAYTYAVLPGDVRAAAYAAYGLPPPDPVTAVPAGAATVPANTGLLIEVAVAAEELRNSFDLIGAALLPWNRNLAEALLLVSGDGPDTMSARLERFDRALQRLMAQAQGAYTDLDAAEQGAISAAASYASFRAELSVAVLAVRTIALNAIDGAYESPSDPDLEAALRDAAARASGLGDLLYRVLSDAASAMSFSTLVEVVPAVAVDSVSLASQATGASTISSSPESFTLTAHISNVSTTSLASISAEVVVTSPNGDVTVVGAVEQPVATGTLDADDGADGAGSDEAELSWEIAFGGDPESLETALIEIRLLENGASPTSFVASNASTILVPDADLRDADADGIPSAFETAHGLNPSVNDATGDLDGDGITNHEEMRRGTLPEAVDSDGDGKSDGEELRPGTDGFLTDPLDVDTDGDDADDLVDGSPADGTTTAPSAPPPEPALAVALDEVVLTGTERVQVIEVTNVGGGALRWTAISDNPSLVTVNPELPRTMDEGAQLTVMLNKAALTSSSGTELPAGLVGAAVGIRVIDVSGGEADEVRVVAYLGERPDELPDGGVPPDGGSPGDEDAGPGAPPDDDDDDDDDNDDDDDGAKSGCGCSAPGGSRLGGGAWIAPAALIVLIGASRRRGMRR